MSAAGFALWCLLSAIGGAMLRFWRYCDGVSD